MNDKEKQIFNFSVIDNKTGKYPDLYNIALKEDWAKGLMYCDMEGFSINEDGQLILSDECGKFVYCPSDRFTVVFEDSVALTREEREEINEVLRGALQRAEKWEKLCGIKIKETRKETAREILKELYLHFSADYLLSMRNEYKDWKYADFIKRYAKQYGVDIGEEV